MYIMVVEDMSSFCTNLLPIGILVILLFFCIGGCSQYWFSVFFYPSLSQLHKLSFHPPITTWIILVFFFLSISGHSFFLSFHLVFSQFYNKSTKYYPLHSRLSGHMSGCFTNPSQHRLALSSFSFHSEGFCFLPSRVHRSGPHVQPI